MSALTALLRECAENPEDDTPRLVLADWPGLGRLTRREVAIDREGAAALAKSPQITGLRELVVSGSMGDAGVEALAGSPYLAGLTCLRIQANRLSEEGEAALRERFGNRVQLHIERFYF